MTKTIDISEWTIQLYYPTIKLNSEHIGIWLPIAIVILDRNQTLYYKKGFAFAITIFGFGIGIARLSIYNKNCDNKE